MSIIGQNSLLNQYVPTIYIKDLLDGQIIKYSSTRRAFVNATEGGGEGDVKAFKQVVNIGVNGTTNIGTILPNGATILSVKVKVTVTNPTATLSVGTASATSDYMTTTENDLQTIGLYIAEVMVVNSAAQIIATVAAQTTDVGLVTIVVTYQIPN